MYMHLSEIAVSARIIFALVSICLVLAIVLLIRKGLIKEKYTLLWLPLSFVFIVFGIYPDLLLNIATILNLHYMTAVLLSVIAIFTLILLYLTVRLSQVRTDMKKLAQDIMLIKEKIE